MSQNPDGKLKSAIGGGMRYDYAYDSMGRLTSKSASGRKLLAYTYDLNGNRSTMTDVTGKCTGYRYNSLDQLLEITDNGKVQARYDYNGDGTIRRMEVGNSLVTEYAYDVDKNLISQKTMVMGLEGGKSPLGTLQGLGNQPFPASSTLKNAVLVDNTYSYDNNANRIEKRTLAGLNRFAYDSVNRLIKAEYPTGAEEYRYGKAGNRTAKITAGLTEQYHYDSCNRLTRLDILPEDRNQPQQIKCFYYDNQGNMLSDGNRQYVYDAMNRLSEVKNTDGSSQKNYYDGEGLRAELEENGRLVSFIFDGDRVVNEKDDENTIRYIRGYELISSDSEKARTYYHYACDEMGSITHVTDEAGSILNRYEYDAFGDCTYKDETVANRFGFAGEQFDPVAGMYYLRARFYNPVIGRFIQEDTYYGDGLNLYAYCHNNPVGYVDPSGHEGICSKKFNRYKEDGFKKEEAYVKAKRDYIAKIEGPEAAAVYFDSQYNKMKSRGYEFSDVWNEAYKYDAPNKKRNAYMGRTPSKKSITGQAVIERMRAEGKIRGTGDRMQFMDRDGNWHPIKDADMAHRTDAVAWWNQVGRYYGPRHQKVRKFMLDPNNYYLEYYSINRSDGAKLNKTYMDPVQY